MAKPTQSVYRTARGTHIDMLKLMNQNEMTIAVGNMKVNARGDEIGQGGKVVKQREEVRAIRQQPAKKDVSVAVTDSAKSKKEIDDMDPEGNE